MKTTELRIGNLLQGPKLANHNHGFYSDGVIEITA
jgi:hypothetical protein